MGGYGSGRQGGKRTIGRTRAYVLDLASLRGGSKLAQAGFTFTFRSDWDTLNVGVMVDMTSAPPQLWLKHLSRSSAPGEQVYSVSLTATEPHLGGVRWWFRCPRTARRVAKLYLPIGGRRFLSRQAYGLVHNTRQMSTIDRQSHRVNKIAARLGAPESGFLDPPDKPPRMRWTTYDRLVTDWTQARDAYWDSLDGRLMRSRWFKMTVGAVDFG